MGDIREPQPDHSQCEYQTEPADGDHLIGNTKKNRSILLCSKDLFAVDVITDSAPGCILESAVNEMQIKGKPQTDDCTYHYYSYNDLLPHDLTIPRPYQVERKLR